MKSTMKHRPSGFLFKGLLGLILSVFLLAGFSAPQKAEAG